MLPSNHNQADDADAAAAEAFASAFGSRCWCGNLQPGADAETSLFLDDGPVQVGAVDHGQMFDTQPKLREPMIYFKKKYEIYIWMFILSKIKGRKKERNRIM